MINFNGNIIDSNKAKLSISNRGYHYGDALFETVKVVDDKILFWEDHYFRLMASMRILRMEIPMHFTLEYLETEILKTVEASQLQSKSFRIKLSVNRVEGGLYLPTSNDINYFISVDSLDADTYSTPRKEYNIELFKDYFLTPQLLSTLKTTNRTINIIGSIFANENGYDNCLLLNTDKHVVEALNANLFLVKDNVIKTPTLSDGCIKGVMRKQIIDIVSGLDGYKLEETSISPFELQKADELFITNIIIGIQPITHYRKKEFSTEVSDQLLEQLNSKISCMKDPQEH